MNSVVHIGIFGKRNAGKSSLINAVTGQDVAIVSDRPGTTTDPVRKRMEIFGLGPCVFIDTAGLDDTGELGQIRVNRTGEIVAQIDLALLLFNGDSPGNPDSDIIRQLKRYSVPFILVHGKSDLCTLSQEEKERISRDFPGVQCVEFTSAAVPQRDESVRILLDAVRACLSERKEKSMFEGIVTKGQRVLLVCPQDGEAPTGRLILPQVNAIRSLLDIEATVTVIQPVSLAGIFAGKRNCRDFDLVVTDSQVFSEVAEVVPEEIPLTSFSMLLARSKGCFEQYCKGTPMIDRLKDGDRVLVLESCSHHSSCEDIGRVKIPAMLRKKTGKNLIFDVVGGLDTVRRPVTDYALVLQCGGCMITSRQLYSRLLPAIDSGVPVTNYGMAISYVKGIYERAMRPLKV